MTVVKNEARMTIRRQRRRVDLELVRGVEQIEVSAAGPSDLAMDRHESSQGREALLRISPDQARCLLLRADGLSYEEITEITGFSFAKVHRALHEGRRVYRGLLQRIETGAECRRLEPLISKFVDGEASQTEREDVLMHVRNCAGCRTTMRDFSTAPHAIATALPLAIALGADAGGRALDRVAESWSNLVAWVNERAFGHVAGGHVGELAVAKKLALVTAAAGTLVAGGSTIERITDHDRPAAVRSANAATPPPKAPVESKTSPDTRREPEKENSRERAADASPAAASSTDVIESDLGENDSTRTPSQRQTEPRAKRAEPLDNTGALTEVPEDAVREPLVDAEPAP